MEDLRRNIEEEAFLPDDPVSGWSAAFGENPSLMPVDFRSLAAEVIARDRSTHLLHPYPAKLIPEIPHLFLRSGLVTRSESGRPIVADPFCGSGTVLVEGILAGFDVVGADTNPLARLIARVKTRAIAPARINRSLANVCRWMKLLEGVDAPPVVNIKYWYSKRLIAELSKLREAISRIRSDDVREFMLVCLSVCARKLSYADPRLSVPVKINRSREQQYGAHFTQLNNHLKFLKSVDVTEYFASVVLRNSDRLRSLDFEKYRSSKVSIYTDAIGLGNAAPNSVDLVITSPPYLGAQKYIRASSLSLGWLGLAHEKDLRGELLPV